MYTRKFIEEENICGRSQKLKSRFMHLAFLFGIKDLALMLLYKCHHMINLEKKFRADALNCHQGDSLPCQVRIT